MSVPMSQYEALLEEVRCLRRKAQHVQQLAAPLLASTSAVRRDVATGGGMSFSQRDATMESPPRDVGLEFTSECDRVGVDGDATGSEDECGRTHVSVSSEPISQKTRGLIDLYHGTWPGERTTLWNSEPANTTPGGAFVHQRDQTSVMSFASSSGGAPLDRVLCSPDRSRRSSQQLEAKMDMVYSLLAMLGGQEHADMGETLLALSTSPESCLAMRQSGCIPLLVQLVQSDKDGETRKKAAQALHNLIHAQPDEKLRKRETRVLKLLEQASLYIEALVNNTEYVPDVSDEDKHPVLTVAHLMKLSFDEGHRQAICHLGGIHVIASLVETEHSLHSSTIDDTQCVLMRRYACMALTNLTFGDSGNKALLCSYRDFMRALVVQLQSPSDELRQVTASVLRNLSWRADPVSKEILREVGTVTGLMKAAMIDSKENTLKSILSALWNLSAHCTENKAEICSIEGALGFLVDMLSYKTPSKSLAVIENSGGILRNISSQIAVREDYREILRQHDCLQVLLEQLKSPSLTIVSNACGTLWNLSAKNAQDQETLWQMGAPSMLRSLNHSKHKMIAMGSSAALKNLLSSRPSHALLPQMDATAKAMDLPVLPTLGARKQKALLQDLDQNLLETFDNVESPTKISGDEKFDKYIPTNEFLQKTRKNQIRSESQECINHVEFIYESRTSKSDNSGRNNYEEAQTRHERLSKNTRIDIRHHTEDDLCRTFSSLNVGDASISHDLSNEPLYGTSSLPYTGNVRSVEFTQNYNEIKPADKETKGIKLYAKVDSSNTYGMFAETDVCKNNYVQGTAYAEVSKHETHFMSKTDLQTKRKVLDNDHTFDEKDHCSVEDISEIENKPNSEQLSYSILPDGRYETTEREGTIENGVIKADASNNEGTKTKQREPHFSSSSSLGSIEIEQHFLHDDRSSIISDLSCLTSNVVSPCELLDSPTETVPPNPKPRIGYLEYPSTSQRAPLLPRTVIDCRPQPAPRFVQKSNVTKFKEDNTSVQLSTTTSGSIDDHDGLTGAQIKVLSSPQSENTVMESLKLDEEVAKQEMGPENVDDDNAECLNTSIPNNRNRSNLTSSKVPTLFKYSGKSQSHGSGISMAKTGIPTRHVAGSSRIPKADIQPDSIKIYTENSTLSLGSNPDFCTTPSDSKIKNYLSDDSYMCGNKDESFVECVQSRMPTVKKHMNKQLRQIPTLMKNVTASCFGRNIETTTPYSHRKLSTSKEIASVSVSEEQPNMTCQESALEQSSNMPKSKINVMNEKPVGVATKQFSVANKIKYDEVRKEIEKSNKENKEKPLNSENVHVASTIENECPTSIRKPLETTLVNTSQIKYMSTEDPIDGLEEMHKFIEHNDHNVNMINNQDVKIATNSIDTIPSSSSDEITNRENLILNLAAETSPSELICSDSHVTLGIQNLTPESHLNSSRVTQDDSDEDLGKIVNNRMLDPDAMIESLERYTAELVSQAASHLQNKEDKFQTSVTDGDTWNDDTSPNDVTFPSISGSTPNVITFGSDSNEIQEQIEKDEDKQSKDVVDGSNEELKSNDFSSLNTSTLTESTLIAMEATRLATNFKIEADMSQSAASLELDMIQPPSQLNSLTNSMNEVEIKSKCSPKLIRRKKSLPAALMVRRALSNSLNQATSLESLENHSLSNLDHMNPPSAMGEVDLVDLEGSMTSVASLQSEVADVKTDFLLNGIVTKEQNNVNPIFQVKQPLLHLFSNSSHCSELENINPPSIFNEITDMCNSLADFPTVCSEAENFEDCESTLQENDALYSDATTATPIQTDVSSNESTPKKTLLTAKQRRLLAKERYKTYTVDSEILNLSEEPSEEIHNSSSETYHTVQNTYTKSPKITPKERRQNNHSRFQTQVLDESICSVLRKSKVENCVSQVDDRVFERTNKIPNGDDATNNLDIETGLSSSPIRSRFETPILDDSICEILRRNDCRIIDDLANLSDCERIETPTDLISANNSDGSCPDSPAKNKLSVRRNFLQKRLENKDRFQTKTISESSLSPEILSGSPTNNSDLHFLLQKEANVVLRTLNESKSRTDELLDCETLSLVSNEDDSEHNSGCSINYRTYHKSWGFSGNNVPVIQDPEDCNSNLNSDPPIEDVDLDLDQNSDSDVEVKMSGKPKIVKPDDTPPVCDDVVNEEEPKGIRGRRKPLYVKTNLKIISKNQKASNLKNVGLKGKSVIAKPPIPQTKMIKPPIKYGATNSAKDISPVRQTKCTTKVAQKAKQEQKKEIKSEPKPKLERQGTFTKEENISPKGKSSIPAPTTSIPKPSSRIARPATQSNPVTKTKLTNRQIPKTGITKSASTDRANQNQTSPNRVFNRSPSADTRDVVKRNSLQASSSNQSLKSSGVLKRCSAPEPTQRSSSTSSVATTGSTKQITSRIACLWKKVEENKKQAPKVDTRVWIQTNRNQSNGESSRLIRSNTFDNKDGVGTDQAKRVSRLGSFVVVDESESVERIQYQCKNIVNRQQTELMF